MGSRRAWAAAGSQGRTGRGGAGTLTTIPPTAQRRVRGLPLRPRLPTGKPAPSRHHPWAQMLRKTDTREVGHPEAEDPLEASHEKRKTQLVASSREFPSTLRKMQSSTWSNFLDEIRAFRLCPRLKFTKRQRKPSADRKPGVVAEREGAAAGKRLLLEEALRTPKPVLAPSPDPRLPPGRRTVSEDSRRRARLGKLLCTPPPHPARAEAAPTPAPRAHTPGRSRRGPARGAPSQRAPEPEQVQPRRAPGRVYTNLLARGWGNPARSPRGGPGWGTRRSHSPRDRGQLGRPLRRPRARLPGAPSPQPRSARSLGALGARTPPGGPRRGAARRAPGTGRRHLAPWAADVRAEPRRRSKRAPSGRRATGDGRRASGRPALHMLTRAARGQRPAAAAGS